MPQVKVADVDKISIHAPLTLQLRKLNSKVVIEKQFALTNTDKRQSKNERAYLRSLRYKTL